MSGMFHANASALGKIAVCGAGIGGLALAIRLAELGFRPSVFEQRNEADVRREGAFLTLAPNGMNGLRAIGCYDAIRESGIETTGIEICNARGKRLGFADQADHTDAFGAPSVTISRGFLAETLLRRARDAGVELRFSTPVRALSPLRERVRLEFAGGESCDAAIVIAADGLRSTVRAQAFPEYHEPHFTGLIGTGGITQTDLPGTGGVMRMTFGEAAFFGYLIDEARRAYWFTSYSADAPSAGSAIDGEAFADEIRRMHVSDPEPNRAILAAVRAIDRRYPVFDMPELPAWSRDRVVLLGDAAHAVGPHAGQGAAMAIEDALVLAACLQSEADHQPAFRRYERLRRPRVAEIVKLTARNSSQKRATGRWNLLLRDLLLPIFIPLGIRAGRKLFRYRADDAPLGRFAA
jgi:2-polyprenyl-6-methoxyphenol hydroxylase-like FAD-dependent oxidoreductase